LHLRSLTLLPVVLLCASAAHVAAQANQPDQTPTIKTNVRAVAVDVVVTRGDDEPVTALHKQDFQIFEDGKPQSIDFFEEHTVHNLPPGALPPLPPMPPNVYSNVPAAPPDDAVNVLLLDSLNTEKQDQVFMHKQILEFLRHMQPNTRTAVFTLGSKLRFVQSFTSDSSALIAALNDRANGFSAEKNAAYSSQSDKADDANVIATHMAMLGGSDAGIDSLRQSQSDFGNFQYGDRAMMTLEALNYLARYLASVPGRKNLIWFASSFPVTIFPSAQQSQSLNQLRVLASSVKSTADLLTVSKVAVYPINAQGMMVEHNMQADNAGPSSMGDVGAYSREAADRADTVTAMQQLAADTGGKAFYNTNDLDAAMSRAINDGAHYYSIVYTPTNKKLDGKYRRIEVKIDNNHLKLSYRRGYNADDTAAQAQNSDSQKPESDPLRPLLMRGLPSASQLLYAVRVVPANPQPAPDAKIAGKNSALTGAVTRYSVDFFIRWTDVEFTPGGGDSHLGKIQLGLMAYNRSGKALNWLGATQQMQLQPTVYAAIQKSGIPAHMDIDLPNNTDVFLETGVYDWGSNKTGTLEIPIHSASPDAATPSSTPSATAAQPAPKTN
jgi:VWFA-related protein